MDVGETEVSPSLDDDDERRALDSMMRVDADTARARAFDGDGGRTAISWFVRCNPLTRKLSPTTCAPADASEDHAQSCAASSRIIVARETTDDARGDRRRARAMRIEVCVDAREASVDATGAGAGMHRGVTTFARGGCRRDRARGRTGTRQRRREALARAED